MLHFLTLCVKDLNQIEFSTHGCNFRPVGIWNLCFNPVQGIFPSFAIGKYCIFSCRSV